MSNILVTGGAGYIGSHTCLALAQNGYTRTTQVRPVKELVQMLDRETIELLAGVFVIVFFGVVLVLIQQ